MISKSILITDDDPSLRELMEILFTSEGYTVDLASNGKEAMGKILKNNYDLIILDFMMPIMDGLEFLIWLRKVKKLTTPVTMLTAVEQQEKQQQLLDAGATKVLGKPIDPDRIVSQITSMLQ